MEKQYIISILWLAGFLLSRWMLKVEYRAEGREMTNGDEVKRTLLSAGSIFMVLFILIICWSDSVRAYWSQPAKPKSVTKKPDA